MITQPKIWKWPRRACAVRHMRQPECQETVYTCALEAMCSRLQERWQVSVTFSADLLIPYSGQAWPHIRNLPACQMHQQFKTFHHKGSNARFKKPCHLNTFIPMMLTPDCLLMHPHSLAGDSEATQPAQAQQVARIAALELRRRPMQMPLVCHFRL